MVVKITQDRKRTDVRPPLIFRPAKYWKKLESLTNICLLSRKGVEDKGILASFRTGFIAWFHI